MITLLVQTDRIISNFRLLQKQAGKAPLIPCLEANACGFGDAAVARLLVEEGARMLAVSRLEEAVRVAEAVRGIDIFLLTPYAGEPELETILENDLIASIDSNDAAVLLSSLSRRIHRRARIQLCIDFGSGRFGYTPQEVAKAAQTIKHLGNLELTGVFTVLPSGSKGKSAVRQNQEKEFGRVLSAIEREGLNPGISHMMDIQQFRHYPEMKHTAVRTNADLFGRGPEKEKSGLKKVGRAVSEVCNLKWLTAGSTVGDDGRTKVRKATRVAVVPVGLADGLFQEDSRRSFFHRKKLCEINGKRVPIIGRVGLTACTIDVTDIECSLGDIVSFDVNPVGLNAFARREYV